MFQGCSKDVLRVFAQIFKGVSIKLQGSFKEVSKVFEGSFKEFQECVKGVSRKIERHLKEVFKGGSRILDVVRYVSMVF